jgi:predicted RND superfamily exporter protein
MFALTAFLALFVGSQTASASVITDLPEDFGTALGISTNLAGMILSIAMIVALVLVLAVADMPPIGIIIATMSVIILLTVMTWLDQVVLIFSGIIIAIYFGLTVKGMWGTAGG